MILDFFLSVGLGLGGTATPEARFRKSISSERTFSATEDAALLYQKLGRQSQFFFFFSFEFRDWWFLFCCSFHNHVFSTSLR